MTTVGAWLAGHPDLDRRDREVLLCRASGLSRAQVMARPERPLAAALARDLDALAERRRRGEPVAYILGEREFWGLTLEVTPAVLVPRPETELLVETALETLGCHARAGALPGARSSAPTESRSGERSHGPDTAHEVLELGTGSGAVAIALATECAGRALPVNVTATDVSAESLAVAARNARRHHAAVHWLYSNWFHAVGGRYDVIVSSPPYVAEDDPHLPHLTHEPTGALVAGPDGLDALRAIVAGAPAHLVPGGRLALEHGFDQGAAVRELLTGAGFRHIHTRTDLAGLPRVTWGQAPEVAL